MKELYKIISEYNQEHGTFYTVVTSEVYGLVVKDTKQFDDVIRTNAVTRQ